MLNNHNLEEICKNTKKVPIKNWCQVAIKDGVYGYIFNKEFYSDDVVILRQDQRKYKKPWRR